MFFATVLIIWTAMHVYVFWRAASVPLIARHIPWYLVGIIGAILWASFPASRMLGNSAIARMLGHIGENWLGVLFLLFVASLAADVVTGFGFAVRSAAPSVRGWALLIGGVLSAIALVQAARAPIVQNFEVQMANLPPSMNGTVVVVASDLHLGDGTTPEWMNARIDQINAQHPDLVVLAGDILEGHGEEAAAYVPILKRLTAPMGVWAVNGNHESYGRGTRPFESSSRLLSAAGFQVLQDRWAEARPGLIISGVDDLTARRRRGQPFEQFVDRALAGRPAGATVFISHTPWLAERVAAQGGNLMLSGHTHNGQIWPFTYIVRLTYPLLAGRYDVNGMPVIVCRGTRTWGPRMRLWQRGEILRITLRAPQVSAKS